jgi:hypothetical protein
VLRSGSAPHTLQSLRVTLANLSGRKSSHPKQPISKNNSECDCLHIRRAFAPTECSRSVDQPNSQTGDDTMSTKARLGLAITLVIASGALAQAMAANAQQNPWVPSGVTRGSHSNDELYNSCYSSHPVFSCPGG